MAKRDTLRNGSKTVYTSGKVSEVEKAMWRPRVTPDHSIGAKSQQLYGVGQPLPSQQYAFQRGLAQAALQLPKRERATALAEVLAAMGLLQRVFPRMREEE